MTGQSSHNLSRCLTVSPEGSYRLKGLLLVIDKIKCHSFFAGKGGSFFVAESKQLGYCTCLLYTSRCV